MGGGEMFARRSWIAVAVLQQIAQGSIRLADRLPKLSEVTQMIEEFRSLMNFCSQ